MQKVAKGVLTRQHCAAEQGWI